MSVYVDEIRDWTLIAKARGLRHTHWCHLTADTEEELHAFAARLGLRRSWFQKKSETDYRWHYDVTPSKREQAVRLGAQEVDRRFIGRLMIRRQEERDAMSERQGPPCGNNPNIRLTPGDRAVVDEFRAHLARRAERSQPCPDCGHMRHVGMVCRERTAPGRHGHVDECGCEEATS